MYNKNPDENRGFFMGISAAKILENNYFNCCWL
jgi:hypothetical protein